MISTFRTSDFQISGSAISSHKNIQGGIFTDEQMAAAMIDRLVHHGHLIMFDGKSYRMQHALMRQTVPQNEEIVS